MEFDVKGITFKIDDLKPISLDELKAGSISRHHLFYSFSGNKKIVSLLHAGDFIDDQFIQKYKSKGIESLLSLEVSLEEDIYKYKKLWNDFKLARSQKERMQIRDLMFINLFDDFVKKSEMSYLSFTIASYEAFYSLPNEILENYQKHSIILYTRALLMSSKLSILALAGNYLDYSFIKDFYNTAFMLDYGFIEHNSFNYFLSQACEIERNTPGLGLDYLENQNRPNFEKKLFSNHPNASFEAAVKFKQCFTFPELLEFIKIHHEKTDGTGFPNGLTYAGMGMTEGLLIYCDYLIPFEEHLFEKGDGHKVLITYFENLKKINQENKLPIKNFINMWEGVLSWGSRSMEVAG